ncbi:hypothetical protein [Deinococcus ruber]|uniref:Uncharacterized protein n=1 Tax=Deinococcus ruber TaxID=1848197 RepID=A0A918C6M3_9DEIO|nr:hypothetical protein [Deinococcus ruber]GGR09316.1 hypothetical protein GCM10008957_22520 [Deinococcus ruber]
MPTLLPLINTREDTIRSCLETRLRPGYTMSALEFPQGRQVLYAAVRHPDQRVRALLIAYDEAWVHGRAFVSLDAPVREEANPPGVDVTPAFLQALTPLSELFGMEAAAWRARVRQHHAWQRLNRQGDVLLGDYGGPGQYGDDTLSYNEAGKKRFRMDSLRYLKRLQQRVGWPGKPSFNVGGVAGSGEAILHLCRPDGVGVFVQVDAGCPVPLVRHSVQGVQIMWRFEQAGLNRSGPNQWADWNITAEALATRILQAHAGGRCLDVPSLRTVFPAVS